MLAKLLNFFRRDDRDEGYKPYTTEFDRIVAADELNSVLGQLSPQDQALVDQAWDELTTGLLPWRTRMLLVAAEASARIRARLSAESRQDTVVALLVDQSGSMRGQKILFAAAALDDVQECLTTLGISCEVLGFTTTKWQGGLSRMRWKGRSSNRNPGRLNDLLHIVYRDASDTRASTGGWHLRSMLRPDLLKENVDGEAIQWAASRSRALSHKRKLLVVLSDGAPVDDSTLASNPSAYLWDHLKDVVREITEAGDIELAGFGIGYTVAGLYPTSAYVDAPSDMCAELLDLLEKMLTAERHS